MPFVEKVDNSKPVVKPATAKEALPAVLVAAFAAFGGKWERIGLRERVSAHATQ